MLGEGTRQGERPNEKVVHTAEKGEEGKKEHKQMRGSKVMSKFIITKRNHRKLKDLDLNSPNLSKIKSMNDVERISSLTNFSPNKRSSAKFSILHCP